VPVLKQAFWVFEVAAVPAPASALH
jgi:hypothetical protein